MTLKLTTLGRRVKNLPLHPLDASILLTANKELREMLLAYFSFKEPFYQVYNRHYRITQEGKLHLKQKWESENGYNLIHPSLLHTKSELIVRINILKEALKRRDDELKTWCQLVNLNYWTIRRVCFNYRYNSKQVGWVSMEERLAKVDVELLYNDFINTFNKVNYFNTFDLNYDGKSYNTTLNGQWYVLSRESQSLIKPNGLKINIMGRESKYVNKETGSEFMIIGDVTLRGIKI